MAVKAYSLQQNELEASRALEEERRDALARFGALTLDMENARQQLQGLENRRRSFLDSLALRVGAPREYRWLSVRGSNLEGDFIEPDAAMTLPAEVIPPDAARRQEVNGRG